MEEKEEKTLTKKDLKLQAQAMKLEEKQRKAQEKAEIKAEKERRKNSFGRKVRNFFLTIIVVLILLVAGFFLIKDFLTKKEAELSNNKMSQIYDQALSEIEGRDYREAIKLLESISSNYDKYEEVEKKLKETEQLYLNEYLVEADKYLKDKKYDKAIEALDDIEQELKDSKVVNDKISEIHIEKIKNKLETLEKEETTISILKFLNEYETQFDEVKDQIEELTSKYKNKLILETRELMKTDYAKAKENIESAKKIFKEDDKDVKALVEELDKTEPTQYNLMTLKSSITKGKLTISNGTNSIKDKEGNEYKNYILSPEYKSGSTDNEITYSLDKKYSKLSGKICIYPETTAIDATELDKLKITIYDGDKVIYFSDKFDKDNYGNIDFSVDVSNVSNLKISFKGTSNLKYFIGNPMITIKK